MFGNQHHILAGLLLFFLATFLQERVPFLVWWNQFNFKILKFHWITFWTHEENRQCIIQHVKIGTFFDQFCGTITYMYWIKYALKFTCIGPKTQPVINGYHATSLLPNPIMVWTGPMSTHNLRSANTKLELQLLSLVQTTIGFVTVFYDCYVCYQVVSWRPEGNIGFCLRDKVASLQWVLGPEIESAWN